MSDDLQSREKSWFSICTLLEWEGGKHRCSGKDTFTLFEVVTNSSLLPPAVHITIPIDKELDLATV